VNFKAQNYPQLVIPNMFKDEFYWRDIHFNTICSLQELPSWLVGHLDLEFNGFPFKLIIKLFKLLYKLPLGQGLGRTAHEGSLKLGFATGFCRRAPLFMVSKE
jgi:hypothetical protein